MTAPTFAFAGRDDQSGLTDVVATLFVSSTLAEAMADIAGVEIGTGSANYLFYFPVDLDAGAYFAKISSISGGGLLSITGDLVWDGTQLIGLAEVWAAAKRLLVVPGSGPVAVIPAPAESGKCTVYIDTVGGNAGARIFISPSPKPAGAADYVIDPGRNNFVLSTDLQENGTAHGEIDIFVDPTNGTEYHFECERLGINNDHVLTSGVFDLSAFIVNPLPA